MGIIDGMVRAEINAIDPGHFIPDENNRRSDGRQYAAPDHSIFNGKILIERKSRNSVDKSQLMDKIERIAQQQGHPLRGYGICSTEQMLKGLPDPDGANRQMTDYLMSQTFAVIKAARRQFDGYVANASAENSLKLLIISDESEIRASNAADEYFIGRKMGALGDQFDETGIIDAIILVKNPEFVIDEENSFWFKFIVKNRVGSENIRMLRKLAEKIKRRLARTQIFASERINFKSGYYRPLVV